MTQEVAPIKISDPTQDIRLPQNQEPSVSQGRLAFSGFEHFNKYVAYLHSLKKLPINKFAGFVSRYDININNSSETLLSATDSLVQDKVFAFVLNKDYELSIGDWIYRAGGHYCFLYKKDKMFMITDFTDKVRNGIINLQQGELYEQDSSFMAFATVNSTGKNIIASETTLGSLHNKGKNNSSQILGTRGITDYYLDRRIRQEIWQSGWLLYASSGAETSMERKSRSCFIWCWESWGSSNANTISVSGDYLIFSKYDDNNVPIHDSGNFAIYNTNSSDAKEVFGWNTARVRCFGWVCLPKPAPIVRIQSANVTHSYSLNNHSQSYSHSW